MRLPELSVCGGELGELRREIRSGMKLGIREVAPDEAKAIEAIEQGHHRSAGGEAIGTSEVPVLDQRQRGVCGAGDMIAFSHLGQRAGAHDSHRTRLVSRPREAPASHRVLRTGTRSSSSGSGSGKLLISPGSIAAPRFTERRTGAPQRRHASTIDQRANVSVDKPHRGQLT